MCNNMVIFDQWSYMTMHGTLEVVVSDRCGGIRINRMLFETSR